MTVFVAASLLNYMPIVRDLPPTELRTICVVFGVQLL